MLQLKFVVFNLPHVEVIFVPLERIQTFTGLQAVILALFFRLPMVYLIYCGLNLLH